MVNKYINDFYSKELLLEKELKELNIQKKNESVINIIYYLLNPIFSNFYNLKLKNKHFIENKKILILYLSRHYDKIDIFVQQKISKEIRNKFPYYLVKKELEFLNVINLGVIPYYRERDLKEIHNNSKIDLIKRYEKIEDLKKYNKKVINNLIPLIFANNPDFLIYPERTRRKGKKFKVNNKILEDIITIYNNTLDYGTIPRIVSVDYLRRENNINMKFGYPLMSNNLKKDELKDYLYQNINY